MTWGYIILIAILMVIGAALYEAFIWRGIKHPLSRHAVSDKPDKTPLGMEETDVSIMNDALKSNARLADLNDSKWTWQRSLQNNMRRTTCREKDNPGD